MVIIRKEVKACRVDDDMVKNWEGWREIMQIASPVYVKWKQK